MRACICRLSLRDHPHVVAVHPKDQVEAAEIGGDQLAASLCADVETMTGRNADGPFVRFLPRVVAIGSRRIDQHIADTTGFKNMSHHTLGKR